MAVLHRGRPDPQDADVTGLDERAPTDAFSDRKRDSAETGATGSARRR